MTETECSSSRFYRWTITTLIAIIFFLVGFSAQGERMRTQVTTNTINIINLQEGFKIINTKLDVIIERPYANLK